MTVMGYITYTPNITYSFCKNYVILLWSLRLQEDRHLGGGYRFYLWLKKHNFPEGFQALCLNCQFCKVAENKEAPGRYGKR